ncbi:MAG: HAMP domain-containing histidine kinase [Chloroflexi bacterium]|nr:HAMP domain-containing histidine kinase [Chloroflexota bacterium]
MGFHHTTHRVRRSVFRFSQAAHNAVGAVKSNRPPAVSSGGNRRHCVAAKAASSIGTGDFDQPVPASGPDEVKSLAKSFNDMIARVKVSQQAQRDFVANISHELRTPLTSIQGFSQAILDGTASDPDSARRAANVIHDEAERMSRLVNSLLDLARLDAVPASLNRAPTDLGNAPGRKTSR